MRCRERAGFLIRFQTIRTRHSPPACLYCTVFKIQTTQITKQQLLGCAESQTVSEGERGLKRGKAENRCGTKKQLWEDCWSTPQQTGPRVYFFMAFLYLTVPRAARLQDDRNNCRNTHQSSSLSTGLPVPSTKVETMFSPSP